MSDQYEVTCPHADCYEVLHLTWSLSYTLGPPDLTYDPESADVLAPSMAHAESWQIECSAGHVLLLPGPLGCPCDDPEGPTCPHDPDDFDWSEDTRTIRPHDYQRLRNVLAAIGGDPS